MTGFPPCLNLHLSCYSPKLMDLRRFLTKVLNSTHNSKRGSLELRGRALLNETITPRAKVQNKYIIKLRLAKQWRIIKKYLPEGIKWPRDLTISSLDYWLTYSQLCTTKVVYIHPYLLHRSVHPIAASLITLLNKTTSALQILSNFVGYFIVDYHYSPLSILLC